MGRWVSGQASVTSHDLPNGSQGCLLMRSCAGPNRPDAAGLEAMQMVSTTLRGQPPGNWQSGLGARAPAKPDGASARPVAPCLFTHVSHEAFSRHVRLDAGGSGCRVCVRMQHYLPGPGMLELKSRREEARGLRFA